MIIQTYNGLEAVKEGMRHAAPIPCRPRHQQVELILLCDSHDRGTVVLNPPVLVHSRNGAAQQRGA